jgi:hypothetical protein
VTAVPADRLDRALRVLRVLLAVAVLVSIVHYVDNVANYDDFPVPPSGRAPSRTVVAAAWFLLTPFALAGLLLLRRRRLGAAAACLAVYSASGLVGLGHYTVPGATDMVWWRQAHIIADIACGAAVLAFAVWLARRPDAVDGEPVSAGAGRARAR